MGLVNKHIREMEPYKVASHEVWDVPFSMGDHIGKLDWNEAGYPPSPEVYKVLELLRVTINHNWYPNTNNTDLIGTISDYAGVPTWSVQYFAGSDDLLQCILSTFAMPEDMVTILSPTYDNFRAMAQAAGMEVDHYKSYFPFTHFEYKRLYNHIELCKPKICYICNPNNPTGFVHRIGSLKWLVDDFPGTLFVIDEAYHEYEPSVSMDGFAIERDNVIVTRTLSKAFALASFRIGYCIATGTNVEYLNKVRNSKNVSYLSQEVAIVALNDVEYMRGRVKETLQRKEWVMRQLSKIPQFTSPAGVPYILAGAGNFIMLNAPSTLYKEQLLHELRERKMFIRDLSHIEGMALFLRITIGDNIAMQKFVDACVKAWDVLTWDKPNAVK